MDTVRLYKYLDFKGGLTMLEHHNLQVGLNKKVVWE